MTALFFALFVRLSETKLSLQRRAAAQGLVEYALILAFVVIVVVGILAIIGKTTCALWYDEIYKKMFVGGSTPGPSSGTCPS
ncbi:MAG: hypothetical protein M3R24_12540 [Chloroflexota bacterium]|nr:hypothetical protein [Chloroflexota bacterium]